MKEEIRTVLAGCGDERKRLESWNGSPALADSRESSFESNRKYGGPILLSGESAVQHARMERHSSPGYNS